MDTLQGKASSLDVAADENLEKLVEVGENLLKKPVSRLNLDTGIYEPILNCGTNKAALKRLLVFSFYFFFFLFFPIEIVIQVLSLPRDKILMLK